MNDQTVHQISLTDGTLTVTPGDPEQPDTRGEARTYQYTGIPRPQPDQLTGSRQRPRKHRLTWTWKFRPRARSGTTAAV